MDFLTECSKCGKCKQFCPSYQIFLNESFAPRGRLMLIKALEKEKEIISARSLKKRIFSCLLCGTCENLCPLEIKVSNIVYKMRAKMKKNLLLYLFKYFSFYPEWFFLILQTLSHSKLFLKFKKSFFLSKFSNFHIKPKKFEYLQVYSKLKPLGRIAIFSGCSVNYLLPSITNSLIYILNWLNYEVIVPKQNCCGAPLISAGFKKEAAKLAQKNIEIYKSFKIDGVVTPCPTCFHFIGDIYRETIGESIPLIKLSELLESSKRNLEQFIVDSLEESIFFHISCHSANYTKEVDKTIELLKKLGIKNIEKRTGCCGFAGIFSFLFERESMDIIRKKVLEYNKADMIVNSCPNCIIQFKAAMKGKRTLHYIELIHKILLEGEGNGRR
ncbi:MAG: (Fe-S)-binding protein [Thermodesulfovibrio sp.]|nr:(Fe-S)-binding protein [Thermodesulfovibrio sp.]MDW7998037.1 (Fe-S)-binding protein [Thermodesulfovibrio sp.]